MSDVVVSLNQQQLELVEKTLERLDVSSAEELMRLALREFFADNVDGLGEDS